MDSIMIIFYVAAISLMFLLILILLLTRRPPTYPILFSPPTRLPETDSFIHPSYNTPAPLPQTDFVSLPEFNPRNHADTADQSEIYVDMTNLLPIYTNCPFSHPASMSVGRNSEIYFSDD